MPHLLIAISFLEYIFPRPTKVQIQGTYELSLNVRITCLLKSAQSSVFSIFLFTVFPLLSSISSQLSKDSARDIPSNS